MVRVRCTLTAAEAPFSSCPQNTALPVFALPSWVIHGGRDAGTGHASRRRASGGRASSWAAGPPPVPDRRGCGRGPGRRFLGAVSVRRAGRARRGPRRGGPGPRPLRRPPGRGPRRSALTLVSIHAVVLHTGNVLLFSWPNKTVGSDAVLWNPVSGKITNIALSYQRDIFCGGTTVMSDGRVFIAGGHIYQGAINDTQGVANTTVFDPASNAWTEGPVDVAGPLVPDHDAARRRHGDHLRGHHQHRGQRDHYRSLQPGRRHADHAAQRREQGHGHLPPDEAHHHGPAGLDQPGDHVVPQPGHRGLDQGPEAELRGPRRDRHLGAAAWAHQDHGDRRLDRLRPHRHLRDPGHVREPRWPGRRPAR